ncbi:MAG: radical SAM protein [Polyangiaceae bacterium]|nr:radical SAM protein [Polyangiaceae bacterium]
MEVSTVVSDEVDQAALPLGVIWDVTYACPLRCAHCYSESGRRPPRQLALPEMLRLADVIAAMRPMSLQISGGEPLMVRDIPEVVRRVAERGIPVGVCTSGLWLDEPTARALLAACVRIEVSLDGAARETHDRIRGQAGAFDQALGALALLDRVAAGTRSACAFGINCTVVRSNLGEIERLAGLASRFAELRFLRLNAAIPSGLASREGYEAELLGEVTLERLCAPVVQERLRALLPAGVGLIITDNRELQMHPDDVAAGRAADGLMRVEPDGAVRAMAMYEGTVGNLLDEPPEVIWARARARARHPFVVEQLRTARTVRTWAAAARDIDRYFAAPSELHRLRRRSAQRDAVAGEFSRRGGAT